ncbi:alpha/beta fold hydrolase [Candidatus Roizmanbacteria bacterium]|nr:alpha/beta fold hydrolase [Candidatus Roizmanbacteria bacterium]
MRWRLIFLILVFLICRPVRALEPFIKYDKNPLVITEKFEGGTPYRIQPFVYLENGQYKMWYASYIDRFNIVSASSPDGISWTGNTLYNFNGHDNHDPFLFSENGKYTLYFTSSDNGGSSNFNLQSIASTDGINFDPATLRSVFTPLSEWEQAGLANPFVFHEGGTYFLFYMGHNTGDWHIGLATSADGTNWQECPNNPIVARAGSPALYRLNGTLSLFFDTGNGIEMMETDNLSCDSSWNNRQVVLPKGPASYDSNVLNSPSLISVSNASLLYYSGQSPNGQWSINLASAGTAPVAATPLHVFLPGFFSSWNADAILHNQSVSIFDWKMNPIVREYDGLIKTLPNLSLKEGSDYLIFPYDWRKSVEDTIVDLNTFLTEKVWKNSPDRPVDLTGHSLGGLIARIYTQKYPEKVSRVVTVGSPHEGTGWAYKPVEAGEIEKQDTFLWLAEKTMLTLEKKGVETDRTTINTALPVLRDIFPTYNFLISENGTTQPTASLLVQNTTINTYNPTVQSISSKLSAISGNSRETLSGYSLGVRTAADQLFDLYPDGRPGTSFSTPGDGIIIVPTVSFGSQPQTLALDHQELIFKTDGIKTVLNDLAIPFNDSQIIEGRRTTLSPSLLFFIRSPATIEVADQKGVIYPETDGMIFIENAALGNYTLTARGVENGQYSIVIGELGSASDSWNVIESSIVATPPSSQVDTYQVDFNSQTPAEFFVDQTNVPALFDRLLKQLSRLICQPSNHNLSETRTLIIQAEKNYEKSNYSLVRQNLLQSASLLISQMSPKNEAVSTAVVKILPLLEDVYQASLKNNLPATDKKTLGKQAKKSEEQLTKIIQKLPRHKDSAFFPFVKRSTRLSLQYLAEAADDFKKGELYLTEIRLRIAYSLTDFHEVADILK